ncbi:MAG: plasmid recombination protein [Lachnospiraceae bacterium]|nr:plasmid recombination protein [Lachnospiraceae bacterium]
MMMLREKYCDEAGNLLAEYPSFYQYRYFYRKTRKLENYYISRNGLTNYQRNNRPSEIKRSGNGEKVFYENVVQIGDMYDTGIVGPNGEITVDAKTSAEILDEYARTFQERNPNLYVFNMVLHMDEATPHLHIDYIPVAHGYKTGLETRNSLTKAYQQMGIPRAKNKLENETSMWHIREREYLTELARERGIEITVKGVDRPGLSLPEYKAAMTEVEEYKEKTAELQIINAGLTAEKKELQLDVKAAEETRDDLIKEAEDAESRIQKAQEILDDDIFTKNTLQEKYLKAADDAVANVSDKPVAQKIRNALGQETGYVKVAESDWKKMPRIFRVTRTKDKAVEEMAKDMVTKDSKIKTLTDRLDKCKEFLQKHNLFEAFKEFIKPKEQKKERVSIHERMAEKKIILAEQEPFRKAQEKDQHKKQQIAI